LLKKVDLQLRFSKLKLFIGEICSDPEIIQLVLKLKNDPSKDVKSLMKDIEVSGAEEKVNGTITATEIATEKVEESAPVKGT